MNFNKLNTRQNGMKKMFLVPCFCLLTTTLCVAAETEQEIAKHLVHCGLVADDLAKSDPKYNQSSSSFFGAAGVLTSQQSLVQMMMEDRNASPVTSVQQSEKENMIKNCESLLLANMDKIRTAMSQPKK